MAKSDTPLVCGGIYEFKRPDGATERSVVVCTLEDSSGKKGWLQRYGLAREVVIEGSEVFNSMKLVGAKPAAAQAAPKKEPTPEPKKIRRKKRG